MDFSDALRMVKRGMSVRLPGWTDRLEIVKDLGVCRVSPEGFAFPWVECSTDVLNEKWEMFVPEHLRDA